MRNVARMMSRAGDDLSFVRGLAQRHGLMEIPFDSSVEPPKQGVKGEGEMSPSLGDRDVPPYVRELVVKTCHRIGIDPYRHTVDEMYRKLDQNRVEMAKMFPYDNVQFSVTPYQIFFWFRLDPKRVPLKHQIHAAKNWRIKIKPGTLQKYWAIALLSKAE